MKVTIARLLCALGFHQWTIYGWNRAAWQIRERCTRCGAEK